MFQDMSGGGGPGGPGGGNTLSTANLDLDARPIDMVDSFKGLLTVRAA